MKCKMCNKEYTPKFPKPAETCSVSCGRRLYFKKDGRLKIKDTNTSREQINEWINKVFCYDEIDTIL